MPLLEIKSIEKSFGKNRVLRQVGFTLRTAEIVGLFGRNGCGKSTLLKILFGSLKPDRAAIELDGKPLSLKQVIPEQRIAYLPQHGMLPGSLLVRDAIQLCFREEETLDSIFYAPGITKIDDQVVASLSMGERRYLEILLLGHMGHPFLLLDEPFSMIDPLQKDRIRDFLGRLKKQKGILLTDHYYGDVLKVADRLMVMKDGALQQVNGEKGLVELGYLSNRQFR